MPDHFYDRSPVFNLKPHCHFTGLLQDCQKECAYENIEILEMKGCGDFLQAIFSQSEIFFTSEISKYWIYNYVLSFGGQE